MQLDKLYTPEEEKQLAEELKKRYWEEGWSQLQIIKYYKLSYETFNNFRDKYGLRKSPNQYNKKAIDKKFTKAQLDDLAAKIRVDFLDKMLKVEEICSKYNITVTDFWHIRDRYDLRENDQQHWERTKRANKLKHGVEHMAHIEGHTRKSLETFQKNYGVGSGGRVEVNRRFYDSIKNPTLSFEEFCKVRDAILSGEGLKELLESVPSRYRSYLNLEKLWYTSFSLIQESVERNNMSHLIKHSGVSTFELHVENYLREQFPTVELVLNSKDIIPPFEIDIYLPQYNVGVEINGEYWHSDNHKSVDYHQRKSKACLDKGILLYHYFEGEDIDAACQEIKDLCNYHTDDSLQEITLDFSKDNGARLVDAGFYLADLQNPQVRIHTKWGDVYDAGRATFKKRGDIHDD